MRPSDRVFPYGPGYEPLSLEIDMSGMFGGGGSQEQIAMMQFMQSQKQIKEARRDKQKANEQGARARQTGERSGGSGTGTTTEAGRARGRRGRDMLIGNLTNNLKQKLGA